MKNKQDSESYGWSIAALGVVLIVACVLRVAEEYHMESEAARFADRFMGYLKSQGYQVITLSSRGFLPSVQISKMTLLENLETYGIKKVYYYPSTSTQVSTLSYILDDVEYYVTLRDLLINR